ncbi:hypothetical protein [Leifsonia sp. Leaf264]|uniref:hypothetical protein n=1 Tax=Leifsonia sp. Leaf264 TaxID=1736314 RepID=UPI000AE97D68|nr:hypothetical protein [Leifsonia sp. Leaf264]
MLVSITDLLVRASVVIETTAPTPPDEDLITPGVVGFIATFFVAVATVLLIIDMVRRVRRVNYRDQIREKLLLEQAEAQMATTDAADPDADPDAAPAVPTTQAGDPAAPGDEPR